MKKGTIWLLTRIVLSVLALSCKREGESSVKNDSLSQSANSSRILLRSSDTPVLGGIRQSSQQFLLLNSLYVEDGVVELVLSKEDALSMGIEEGVYDSFVYDIQNQHANK